MATIVDGFEFAMEDIGMAPLPESLRFGRFSLDAWNAHELDPDRKTSFKTVP
jgi:hypothetical protein